MHGEQNEDAERICIMSIECPAQGEETFSLMRDVIP